MLLVRAGLHRDGLVFPCFPYGIGNSKIRRDNRWLGEIETEGLGIMADDMGIECWACRCSKSSIILPDWVAP